VFFPEFGHASVRLMVDGVGSESWRMIHSREGSKMVDAPAPGRVDPPIHGGGIAIRDYFLIHRGFPTGDYYP
jgi:hypothetical protein